MLPRPGLMWIAMTSLHLSIFDGISIPQPSTFKEERPKKKGDRSDDEEMADCVVWVNSFYSVYPL